MPARQQGMKGNQEMAHKRQVGKGCWVGWRLVQRVRCSHAGVARAETGIALGRRKGTVVAMPRLLPTNSPAQRPLTPSWHCFLPSLARCKGCGARAAPFSTLMLHTQRCASRTPHPLFVSSHAQVQEVLSIARELGVLSDCPSALETQPSWVPASLGAPPPPLADRRSEESARSQLQLQQQQQQQMHAPLPPPRLTRGHSHPPSAHVQQQHALQAAPRGRRAEWAEGGNAAPPALLAPDGMQRQPARQLTADQLSELAHLLQRARAAGIQLPALQSWPGPAAQQQPQPQSQQVQPYAAAVQLQQQQLLSQQDEAGTGPMNVQERSAMRVGLQRQISAEAQQAQQAAMQRQISADSQAQHVAMHRQQLLLLEAAQAEQRKQLVHAQHAELLHLEQAWQAQQAQQLLQAVDARRAAPAAQLPPPSGAQPWGQLATQPAQQRGAFALPQLAQPQPPAQPAARPPPPPLQQGALSLFAQQQALLAQQRAEQQRWADAALRLLGQPPRAQQGTVSW